MGSGTMATITSNSRQYQLRTWQTQARQQSKQVQSYKARKSKRTGDIQADLDQAFSILTLNTQIHQGKIDRDLVYLAERRDGQGQEGGRGEENLIYFFTTYLNNMKF